MAATFIDNLRDIMDLTSPVFRRRISFYTNLLDDPGAGGFNDPEKCLQVFKFIELFQDKYLPKIKANAIAQKILNGDALPKGFIAPGLAYPANATNVKLIDYLQHFCANDPLVYNHNGRTNITNIDRTTSVIAIDPATGQPGAWTLAGGAGPPAPQGIPAFIDYFSCALSTQPEVVDALSYLWNPDEPGEVCSKYKMPSVLFTQTVAGAVEIVDAPAANVTGPSRELNRFSDGGVVTGTNVVPGGGDDINLTQIGLLRGSNRVGLGNSSPLPIDKYNSYFTFPNFLLGEMLFMSLDPTTGRPRPPVTYVNRPFIGSNSKNDMEFWVKNYGEQDASFPYDKEKYVLPDGWKMIERADGIIMYLSPENHLKSDPPDGSYYIKKPNVDIARVIRQSVAHNEMVNWVNAAIRNGHGAGGGGGQYTVADMGTANVQNKLKLVAYMKNIEYLKRQKGIAGGNKKKTKRKNIIKHVAKSKKKHNHK
jgi:hypothetical protein